jgi:Ubiquitin-activating enzyme E1 FCCH domain
VTTPQAPSLIWSLPPTQDPPIQQDATFANSAAALRQYRAYRDSQIRGIQKQIIDSLLSGLTGTWMQVDPNVAQVSIGQWVCSAGTVAATVTLALAAAIANAGQPLGIALTAGAPGGWVRVAQLGKVPPSITGLIAGSLPYACVNTTTGYTQGKSSLASTDYPVGTVDTAGNLSLHIQLPLGAASGGSGAFTTTSANFTQPATNATVTVTMLATAWFAVGQDLFIGGGGYYSVTSITDGTHAVLTNLGSTGNAAPGTTVSSGASVSPGGTGGGSSSGGGAKVGLSSARPNASGSGAIYCCSDIPVLYVDDPTAGAWKQFALFPGFVGPAASAYTLNGNLALSQQADTIRATIFSDALQVFSTALIAASLGASATWVVELHALFSNPFGVTFPSIDVIVANGVTTGTSNAWAMGAWAHLSGGLSLHQKQCVVAGARVSAGHDAGSTNCFPWANNYVHLRLLADGVNLHYQASTDGVVWWDWEVAATPTVSYYGFSLGNDYTSNDSICQALIYRNVLTTLTVAQSTITGVTNVSSPVITTSAAHGLQSGDMVAIHGVVGATGVNTGTGNNFNSGASLVKVLSTTTFTLPNVSAPGGYTSGGTVTLVSR